uniref:Uncharacterized protein n=1 Tax=Meloidogyne javanica TaxID=6303 RepID=A0A915LYZ3_MELJA
MVGQLSKVKDAALKLYQPYKEDFEGIKPIENEESINQTFLNQILEKFLESFKNDSKVDDKTMSNAISIWKYFISTFEIPSTTECTCVSKISGKTTRSHSFPKIPTPVRRKRANGCPTQKRHICIIGSALGLILAVIILFILWAKGLIPPHISLFNN